MRPKIGIPNPTSGDTAYNAQYWPDYAAAITEAGGDPMQIALDGSQGATAQMRLCSGFVLPGSPADVDPARYGHTPDPASARPDPAREQCDRQILEIAEITGAPLLGICFGMQMLNVLRAGTLVQDLRPVPLNHAAGPQVGVAHTVHVASRSLLSGLLSRAEAPQAGEFRHLAVNSSHHQAVAIPGQDFTVVARSIQDGVVEAMEGRLGAAPVLAVQWHPERSRTISPASRAIFLWLVSSAMDVAEGVGGRGLADAL